MRQRRNWWPRSITLEELVVARAAPPVPDHLHIAENDSDEEIASKLRRQGVRIGRGGIAPAVFWPALGVIVLR